MFKVFSILVLLYIAGSVIVSTASGNYGSSSPFLSDSVISTAADSLKRLSDGKELYSIKCSKCHALHKPKEYRLKIWKENLDEMKDKAALTDSEYALILNYLKTNCKK